MHVTRTGQRHDAHPREHAGRFIKVEL